MKHSYTNIFNKGTTMKILKKLLAEEAREPEHKAIKKGLLKAAYKKDEKKKEKKNSVDSGKKNDGKAKKPRLNSKKKASPGKKK